MLEPEKGQLENVIIDGRKVTLNWLVRSLQPLSEAVLDYKMSGVSYSINAIINKNSRRIFFIIALKI